MAWVQTKSPIALFDTSHHSQALHLLQFSWWQTLQTILMTKGFDPTQRFSNVGSPRREAPSSSTMRMYGSVECAEPPPYPSNNEFWQQSMYAHLRTLIPYTRWLDLLTSQENYLLLIRVCFLLQFLDPSGFCTKTGTKTCIIKISITDLGEAYTCVLSSSLNLE